MRNGELMRRLYWLRFLHDAEAPDLRGISSPVVPPLDGRRMSHVAMMIALSIGDVCHSVSRWLGKHRLADSIGAAAYARMILQRWTDGNNQGNEDGCFRR